MAEANFKTRRLPQSSITSSDASSLLDHLNSRANIHPQYLLVADYVSGEGTITTDDFMTKIEFATWRQQNYDIVEQWKINVADGVNTVINYHSTAVANFTNLLGWQTTINGWKTGLDTWKTGIDDWKTNTATPAINSIYQIQSDLNTLSGDFGTHILAYAQNYAGVIPSHKDTAGQELYARRIHTHTAGEIGASADDHLHDDDYLRIDDIHNNRLTPNNTQVNSLDSIFSTVGHSHYQYVNYTDLSEVGIYPTSKNPFKTDDEITTFVINLNRFTTQGIYDIHKTSAMTVNNAPTSTEAGTLVVINSQAVDSVIDTSGSTPVIVTPGVHTAQQLFMSDNGAIWSRIVSETDTLVYAWSNDESGILFTSTASGAAGLSVYDSSTMIENVGTTTAGDSASITVNGVVYTRDSSNDTVGSNVTATPWKMVNAPSRINNAGNVSYVSSGASYVMNCLNADIYNIQLSSNCTLTLSNLTPGQTAYLYVSTNGTYTLTYNSVMLLSTEDSGIFRIEFQHDGVSVRCINVMTILA